MQILTALFIGMAALALSGCSQVEIKDIEGCVDKLMLGAHCAHTLTTETREIPGPIWNAMPDPHADPAAPPTSRFGRVSISLTSLGDIKTMIEQLCSKTECTKEQKALIKKFHREMTVRPWGTLENAPAYIDP